MFLFFDLLQNYFLRGDIPWLYVKDLQKVRVLFAFNKLNDMLIDLQLFFRDNFL